VWRSAEKAIRSDGAASQWIGELAVFASALSGAVCSVLYRPYLKKYPTLPVSAYAMLASVGFLTVLAAAEGFFDSPPRFTPWGWLAVAYIGIGSGIGYFLWLWALRHATPTQVSVFLALSPVTAAGSVRCSSAKRSRRWRCSGSRASPSASRSPLAREARRAVPDTGLRRLLVRLRKRRR